MSAPITHLLYLHGFRSAPQSTKARMTAAWVQAQHPDIHWCCPQLPASPRAAMALVMDLIDGNHPGGVAWPDGQYAVIGSSLGGFYATAVAQRTGCRAVLLNPAVNPARDLVKYIGELEAWHSDERLHFDAAFIDELHELTPLLLTDLARYFAVIAKGDEVLDWREMAARYAGCAVKLLEGSDHALSDYAEHLPDLADFLGLAPDAVTESAEITEPAEPTASAA